VQKPERILMPVRKHLPIVTNRFKQSQGANHIGLDECARTVDRAIHMAFGGEIQHCIGLVLLQQARDQGAIADIALHENMVVVTLQRCQRVQVSRIGQGVQIDHTNAA